MPVFRRFAYRGVDLVSIPQPDGSIACIPEWMTEESVAHFVLTSEPQIPLDNLRTLRAAIHVLPKGFHRIRHYGLLANGNRASAIATARELLGVATTAPESEPAEDAPAGDPQVLPAPCPCCGGRMRIIETFARGCEPKHRPSSDLIGIDTS